MKILKVVLNNIHSIKGKFTIDFVDGVLGNSGLYAITGQTGAGKSTILDAITLSLYGITNRHGKGNSDAEIITRNEKESFSETYFEINGAEYMARWSVSVNRNKNLNDSERKICKVLNGEITEVLADQKKNTQQVINDIIGLTFEQFTKSVLLAQNNFSAFLKADANERAEMLSKITGTQIYEEISKLVFEKFKTVEQSLAILKSKINNDLLSEEEFVVLKAKIDENELLVKEKNLALDLIVNKLSWLKDIENNETELSINNQKLIILNEEEFANSLIFKQLERFNLAKTIELDLNNYFVNLNSIKENESKHALISAEISTKKNLLVEMLNKQVAIDLTVSQAKNELDQKLPIIKKSRDLIVEKDKNAILFEDLKSKIQVLNGAIKIDTDKKNQLLNNKEKLIDEAALNQVLVDELNVFSNWESQKPLYGEKYNQIVKYHNELSLVDLSRNEVELNQLKSQFNQLVSKSEILLINQKEVQALIELINTNKNTFLPLSDLNEQLFESNQKHNYCEKIKVNLVKEDTILAQLNSNNELLKEYLIQKDDLELKIKNEKEKLGLLNENNLLLAKISSLEAHRMSLHDDEECPLCGSFDHPFVKNNPQTNNDSLSLKIKSSENIVEQLLQNLSVINNLISVKETETLNFEKQISELKNEVEVCLYAIFNQGNVDLNNIQEFIIQNEKDILALNNLITSYHELNSNFEVENSKLTSIKDEIARVKIEEIEFGNKIQLLEQKNALEIKKIADLNQELSACYQEIIEILGQYELVLIENTVDEVINVGKVIKDKYTKWKLAFDLLENCKSLLLLNKNDSEKSIIQLDNLNRELVSVREQFVIVENTSNEIQSELSSLLLQFECKVPDDEETRLRNYLNQSNKELDLLNQEIAKSKVFIEENSKVEFKLLEDIQHGIKVLTELESTLNLFVKESNFESINELQLVLNDKNNQHITALKLRIDQEKQQIIGVLSSASAKIEMLRNMNLTNSSTEVLELEKEHLRFNLNELSQVLGAEKEKIRKHNEELLNNVQLKHEIDKVEKDYLKWKQLNDLIGSKDGKTFKKFAQDFTLSLLVQYANIHLGVMYNRYELVKADDSAEMELQIKDKNFFGALRNINSLSGGETFLVSLSLALGLSDLASKNTKIRSLFIDEGFGTLDPESLNNALDALELLQQKDGRQIGIISHVEELKKRIHTQIQVNKISSEFSEISFVS